MNPDERDIMNKEFENGNFDFPKILTLAKCFGWKPKGTVLGDAWKNAYTYNDWHTVIGNELGYIVGPLKTAVKALPSESLFSDRERREWTSRVNDDCEIIFLIKYFSGIKMKNNLLHFIDVCHYPQMLELFGPE